MFRPKPDFVKDDPEYATKSSPLTLAETTH
jgi:hypothetical protein